VENDGNEGWRSPACGVRWRKSTFSGPHECVAVATVGDRIAIRNSRNPEAGTLLFGGRGFATWVAGIKAGEFDDLSL
jgi:hypothetical protein